MNQNGTIHIVFITDENYAMPTGVAIYSLVKNKNPETVYQIYVLCNEVSKEMQDRLLHCAAEKAEVRIVKLDKMEEFQKMEQRTEHVSKTALYKFMLPEIFGEIDKILYLDGDILVKKDLSDLYHMDITDYYVGAVNDIGPVLNHRPSVIKKLHLNHDYYFNSGVMLLNLALMREHSIVDQLIGYRSNGINFFMDQDALNVVLGTRVKLLSFLYNDINTKYDLFSKHIIAEFYGVDFRELGDHAAEHAVILHFASRLKPWRYNIPYFAELYAEYHQESPFSDIRLTLAPYPPQAEPSSPALIRFVGKCLRRSPLTFPLYKFLDVLRRDGVKTALKKIKPFIKKRQYQGLYKYICWPFHIRKWYREGRMLSEKCAQALNVSEKRASKLVLSLTTFPARIHDVPTTILSLLQQTCKPDKIVLWLTNEEFPNQERGLPRRLLRLKKYGLDIQFRGNLRAHTKYYYAMKEYPNDIVITVDDDIHYPYDLVENLYRCYERHPDAVCAMRAHLITFAVDGTIRPYTSWKYEYGDIYDVPMMGLLATGVGGVLYPPKCMHQELFNQENIKRLCLRADDIWLKFMQVMKNTPVVLVGSKTQLDFVGNTQDVGLCYENIHGGGNDEMIMDVLKEYNLYFGENDTLLSRIKHYHNHLFYCFCCGQHENRIENLVQLCGHCSSNVNERFFAYIAEKKMQVFSTSGNRILHYAPQQGMMTRLSAQHDYYPLYHTLKYEGYIRDIAELSELPYEANYFHYALINLTGEHDALEDAAIHEIYRVLRKNRMALVALRDNQADSSIKSKFIIAGFQIKEIANTVEVTEEEADLLQIRDLDPNIKLYLCKKSAR